MTTFTNIRGTSELAFRISLLGPTLYQGTPDPTVNPPTPIGAFQDGDLYVRQGTGNERIWILESGAWYRIPSGAGGDFFGPIDMNNNDINNVNNLVVNGNTTFSAGTAANPSVTFTGDTDTGIYNAAPDNIGVSTGGTERWRFTNTGDFIPIADNVYNIGSPTNRVDEIYGTALEARYTDLAENYKFFGSLQPGDVVVVQQNLASFDEIALSVKKCDEAVLGVISENPATLMNSKAGELDAEYWFPVALRGRVKVKVIGEVMPGDLLVTSEVRGRARVANFWERLLKPHAVFAKALTVSHKDECEAVIL